MREVLSAHKHIHVRCLDMTTAQDMALWREIQSDMAKANPWMSQHKFMQRIDTRDSKDCCLVLTVDGIVAASEAFSCGRTHGSLQTEEVFDIRIEDMGIGLRRETCADFYALYVKDEYRELGVGQCLQFFSHRFARSKGYDRSLAFVNKHTGGMLKKMMEKTKTNAWEVPGISKDMEGGPQTVVSGHIDMVLAFTDAAVDQVIKKHQGMRITADDQLTKAVLAYESLPTSRVQQSLGLELGSRPLSLPEMGQSAEIKPSGMSKL